MLAGGAPEGVTLHGFIHINDRSSSVRAVVVVRYGIRQTKKGTCHDQVVSRPPPRWGFHLVARARIHKTPWRPARHAVYDHRLLLHLHTQYACQLSYRRPAAPSNRRSATQRTNAGISSRPDVGLNGKLSCP